VIDVGVVRGVLLGVTLSHGRRNLHRFSSVIVRIEHLCSTSEFVCDLLRKRSPLRQPFKSCRELLTDGYGHEVEPALSSNIIPFRPRQAR